MPDTSLEFVNVLAALHSAGARYVLIGGLAMVSHGSAYITQDIDIFFARDQENREAVVRALSPYHPHLRGAPEDIPFFFDARALRDIMALTLTTDMGAVDIMSEVAGAESFDAVWQRSVEMEIADVPVHVCSLDDLIAMKRAANRPKDQLHVMELEALQRLLHP